MKTNLESKIEREGNVTTITKPEGKYTVIYEKHVLTKKTTCFPEGIDGLFLELVGAYKSETIEFLKSGLSRLEIKYPHFINAITKNNIPIYFPDVDANATNDFKEDNIMALKTGGGALSLQIGGISFPYAPLAAYLLLPIVSSMARVCCYNLNYLNFLTAKLERLTEILHPNNNLVNIRFRNALISYKMEKIMLECKDKHYALIIGALHSGIETELQKPLTERLAFLQQFKPLLSSIINDQETFYSFLRVHSDEDKWLGNIYEIPELKELIAK